MMLYSLGPSKIIPALGYDLMRDGRVIKTVRLGGEIVSRQVFYPPKKVRRRIGRAVRRGKR